MNRCNLIFKAAWCSASLYPSNLGEYIYKDWKELILDQYPETHYVITLKRYFLYETHVALLC